MRRKLRNLRIDTEFSFYKGVARFVNMIFFNPLLILVSESLIQLFTSTAIFFNMPELLGSFLKNFNKPTYYLSLGFSIYAIVLFGLYLGLAIAPLILTQTVFANEMFKDRVGRIYAEIDITKKSKAFMTLLYVLRRFSIVYLALFCGTLKGVQLQILIMMNLFCLLYTGLIKPYASNPLNRRELGTEAFILFLSECLVVFTDFCPQEDNKYKIGWLFIGIFMLYILLSFGTMVLKMVNTLYLYAFRFYLQKTKKMTTVEEVRP